MSDINISYEDALRLSELYGQQSELTYSLQHIMMESMSYIAITTVAMVVTYMVLYFAMYMCHDSNMFNIKWDKTLDLTGKAVAKDKANEAFRRKMLALAVAMAVATVALCMLAPMVVEYSLNLELVNVESQIDAILERYEGV